MLIMEEQKYKKTINKENSKNYRTVLTEEDRYVAESYINNYEYLSFDTETTGLNVRKDKVIGFSFSGESGTAFYFPLYTWNSTMNELTSIPENINKAKYFLNLLKSKELLMWNGSFDIRMVKNNFNIDLTSSLIAEGMLLKHTVDEEGKFGLKTVGVQIQDKLGFSVEEAANKEQIELKENVKKNGGSTTKTNFEMYKADLDIMAKYAAADADLTLRICEYYKNKVIEEGLESFFFDEEVMPLYKEVTIPMEDKGIMLDMKLLTDSCNEIEEDIRLLEKDIIGSLMETDAMARWLTDKSTKEFPFKPTGLFAQRLVEKSGLPLPKTKSGKYSLSSKNLEELPECLEKDFLLKHTLSTSDIVNLGFYDISRELWKEKEGNYINISSKKQMGELVFDYMGVKPLSRTERGAPQFNDSMIDWLKSNGYEWAKDLHDYNKLIKIKGAYIDRFLNNNEDGYYYFSYKQHGTISGRYGSDAQQLPRPMEQGQESNIVLKYNNRIRKFFISEESRVFIDSDYESLEPHTFAHVSGDEGLRDIFRNGHDFYSTIAIATEGLYEFSADKKADNYLGKLDKQKRQIAKAYALGVPYGMGGYALGKSLEVSTEEAEELIEGYLGAYPKLKSWMDNSKKMAQAEGHVKSEAGRIRHLSRVKELHSIYGEKLLNFKFRKKLEGRLDKKYVLSMYMDYKNGINNSRNFQIQSMAASIVNRAAIAVNRKLRDKGIDGWCCAQIHDQLIFNVPKNKAEECKKIVQELMQNTTKLSLDLKAPPQIAVNWQEGH